jgi:hypothetical protein
VPLIRYTADADPSVVSARSVAVLETAMSVAGLSSIVVTSTQRTTLRQARIMVTNMLKPNGVEQARKLYRAPGQRVIDLFVELRELKVPVDRIIAECAALITQLGPATVSHHCADPSVRNVLDIAPSSIPVECTDRFVTALQSNSLVSKVLLPSNGDPAIHVEIEQAVAAADHLPPLTPPPAA